MGNFVKQRCALFVALATWLFAVSQSDTSLLQALAKQAGCPDGTDSDAARCLFQSWYPLSHHWKLTSSYSLEKHGAEETYGELEPEGVERIIARISEFNAPLSEADTFVDLGSGVGQVALLVYLQSVSRLVVGIELVQERHDLALAAREHASKALASLEGDIKHIGGQELRLLQGDFTDAALAENWDDATVIFTCSSVFPDDLIERLRGVLEVNLEPGTLVFSMKPLMGEHKDLAPLDSFPVKTSWNDQARVFLYMKNLKPSALNELNLAISDSKSVLDDCVSWGEGSENFATKDTVKRFCHAFAWKRAERAEYGQPRLDYDWVVPPEL